MQKNESPLGNLNVGYKPLLVSAIFLFSDIVAITISFFIPFWIRKSLISVFGGELTLATITPMYLILVCIVVIQFTIKGLYPGEGRTGIVELKDVFSIVSLSFVFLGLAIYVLKYGPNFSRTIYLGFWLLSLIFISFFRVVLHNQGSLLPWWGRPVVIIGMSKDVVDVISRLHHSRRMALNPVAILIEDDNDPDERFLNLPSFPYSPTIQTQLRGSGIDTAVFVSHSGELSKKQKEQLYLASLDFPKLIFVLAESPLSTLSITPLDFEGRGALNIRYNLLRPISIITKRLVDLILCLLSLIITFPLFFIISILIKLDTPGPIFFTQIRLGKHGKEFKLYKFRTMVKDADQQLENILISDEKINAEYQIFRKIRKDPRVTRIGRFLRKTSLDELPQFWNVLIGDLTIVGPRAYLPKELDIMGDFAEIIHRVTPGLTGWWQVMGRHDVDFKTRLKMDEYYISNFSLWMDFYIMIKTIWIIIGAKGA